MFATVALTKLAELASTVFDDPELATRATNLSTSVNTAIENFGVFKGNLTLPKMYAFEVDGFGNQVLMDDANMPNLLSIPYMVWATNHPNSAAHLSHSSCSHGFAAAAAAAA